MMFYEQGFELAVGFAQACGYSHAYLNHVCLQNHLHEILIINIQHMRKLIQALSPSVTFHA